MTTPRWKATPPDRNRLLELLDYDPETGVLTWRISIGKAGKGQVAGCLNEDGYRRLGVNRRSLLAHRIIWLYVYGEWPQQDIDHINGDRDDNRLANLRLATLSENHWNSKRHIDNELGGSKGVTRAGGRWQARISIGNNKRIHLGCFGSQQDAAEAYRMAALKYHGDFARFD